MLLESTRYPRNRSFRRLRQMVQLPMLSGRVIRRSSLLPKELSRCSRMELRLRALTPMQVKLLRWLFTLLVILLPLQALIRAMYSMISLHPLLPLRSSATPVSF